MSCLNLFCCGHPGFAAPTANVSPPMESLGLRCLLFVLTQHLFLVSLAARPAMLFAQTMYEGQY